MKNKSLLGLILLAVVLFVAVIVFFNLKTPSDLVGSWHASPSVSAGFNERYVFGTDSKYTYYTNQNIENDDNIVSTTGTWKVFLGNLILFEKNKTLPIIITLGQIENETDEAIVYEQKIKIGENTYWQYSEETDLWKE